ncbi:hypothetical protein WJX72_004800 [[Myrmecia] bisecta]|uniref:Uncharacterized protein n=1 Tax=[Myrmecia] bisecta TaxID=41462 RepID=A0AAW1P8W1_9CHLO
MVNSKFSPRKIKSLVIGDYDYKLLCTPQWPYCQKKKRAPPPWFSLHAVLPFLVAALMGLQHALPMTGSIIVPALLIGRLSNDTATTQYLIAASLIVGGIGTILHVAQFKIPLTNGRFYYGSGLISVMGVAFTFVPTSLQAMSDMLAEGMPFDVAYGKLLGTAAICTWVTVVLSFFSPRMLNKLFPKPIIGVVMFLVGAVLLSSGFKQWGGGSDCGSSYQGLPAEPIPCQVPSGPNGTYVPGECYAKQVIPLCNTNGQVELPYGSPEYIGLGCVLFLCVIFFEIFGSPFVRNASVFLSLMVAYLVAGTVTTGGLKYVTTAQFNNSKNFQFLWLKTFPLGVYAPAILPFFVAFLVKAAESVGDMTATEELSRVPIEGPEHNRRIQGGLLAVGIHSFFASMATVLPNVIFVENNGVLALTNCASLYAGYFAGAWIILMGIIGKLSAFFAAIPDAALGSLATFIFASICVSGIKLMSIDPITRRVRIILTMSLAVGLGVTIVPQWATANLWPIYPTTSTGMKTLRNSCLLVLRSGFSIGYLIAIVLHAILPDEDDNAAVDLGGNRGKPQAEPRDDSAHNDLPVYKVDPADVAPSKAIAMAREV